MGKIRNIKVLRRELINGQMTAKNVFKIAGPISSSHFDMESTDFNRDGWAFAGDRVLCDQGFYMKNEVIAKEAIAKGFVKTICENSLKN